MCIADLDTRHIASLIRSKGAMSACIIHDEKDINKAKKELENYSAVEGAELPLKFLQVKNIALKKIYFNIKKKIIVKIKNLK